MTMSNQSTTSNTRLHIRQRQCTTQRMHWVTINLKNESLICRYLGFLAHPLLTSIFFFQFIYFKSYFFFLHILQVCSTDSNVLHLSLRLLRPLAASLFQGPRCHCTQQAIPCCQQVCCQHQLVFHIPTSNCGCPNLSLQDHHWSIPWSTLDYQSSVVHHFLSLSK